MFRESFRRFVAKEIVPHHEAWEAADPQAVGCFLNGGSITEPGPKGERVVDESLLSLWNGEADDVTFTLPVGRFPANWSKVVDTAAGTVEALTAYRAGDEVVVPGRSVIVLVAAD